MKVGLGVNPNKMQDREGSRPDETSDIGEELTEGKLLFKICRDDAIGRRDNLKSCIFRVRIPFPVLKDGYSKYIKKICFM